jgi:hypothetical protein
MNDTQFDDFFNDKFKDHAVPVPAGLWDKVVEGQFDQFVGNSLKDAEAPVPEGLWDKINDKQFDGFVAGTLAGAVAPVPDGLWDRISDGQFDRFVAGKLLNHEAPVPAGLWEKVRPEEEDDDKVGFFWFRYPAAAVLILGLLTAGAWGGYLYFSSHNQKAAESPISKSAPAAQEPAGNTPRNNAHPPSENASPVTAPATERVDNSNNNRNLPPAGNAADNRLAGSAPQDITVSGIRRKNGADLLKPLRPAESDLAHHTYDPFRNKTQAADRTLATVDDSETIATYQQNLLPAFIIPTLTEYDMSQNLQDKQLSTLNHTNQFKNIIICPADSKRNTDWYLEAYASPDLSFKSVSNVSASPLYMLKKDSSEHMQVGYSAGLRLVKPLTDNILLKAGVQYSQANEKYVYRTENEVKTTTVVTVRTIIRAPGDTVIVQDTSVLQTVGFRNNTVRNRYRSIDIPLTVGYQFGNEDLKFGINAGVAVNISSWYQGVMLDSSLAIVPLNKTGNNLYKTNIGLGLIGSFSVVKKMSEDMHVFFEPYFRYNLSNMTTQQASFKQRFSVGGLAVGLRINLNRK